MSTFHVTAERLTIHPHPDAERLELAQVGEYRAVVGKGQYQTGDWAIYIPEQALLPDDLIDELGLTGRLAGSKANRVKAIRLRGELSQGIVCQPRALQDVNLSSANGTDFAAQLGIIKWVPEVPSSLSGEMFAAPEIMSWVEIENIKRFPEIFEAGEPVIATEKVHGSCCVYTYDASTGVELISSKGMASKGLAIIESPENLYWRAIRAHFPAGYWAAACDFLGTTKIAIYGEVYGKGVQDLGYGTVRKDTPGYAVFDIAVVDGAGHKRWLEQDQVRRLCDVEIPTVPVIYEGPYDYEALASLAEGSTVVGNGAHIREGIVVRSMPERYSPVVGGRAIAKFISPAYLTRTGGTEYE